MCKSITEHRSNPISNRARAGIRPQHRFPLNRASDALEELEHARPAGPRGSGDGRIGFVVLLSARYPTFIEQSPFFG
jgi:hypothetical protein